MPTTRKKVIKTVYEDENDSEAEKYAGDFSDSGSEAQISQQSSSEDDEPVNSSADEFVQTSKKLTKSKPVKKKQNFSKQFVSKINKQVSSRSDNEFDDAPALFSVKNLTDADKLLPSVLNLSESGK